MAKLESKNSKTRMNARIPSQYEQFLSIYEENGKVKLQAQNNRNVVFHCRIQLNLKVVWVHNYENGKLK